jgi:protein melted
MMPQYHYYTEQSVAAAASQTSNIVHEILCDQDLSRAGNLFTMNNDILLESFPTTLDLLKNIIDNRKYAYNLNEQSLVEIVLTKCISALKETKMIANYYIDLLDIIEICMKYNLNNNRFSFRSNNSDDKQQQQQQQQFITTPHANIVSDILSAILLDYLDPSLTIKAVPVCIKLLQHHNIKRELLREICSYLNLVASRSPDLLIDHVFHITNAIYRGNTCLSRLLFHLCESNVECIYPITKHLIKCLKTIDSNEDLINVLKIMYIISLHHVQIVMVHLEDIIEFLNDDKCRDYVLDVMYSIANQMPIALEPYLVLFDHKAPYYDSFKIDKIIGLIGKSLKGKAEFCTNLLIQRLKSLEKKKINSLLTKQQRTSQRYSHQLSIDENDLLITENNNINNNNNSNSFRRSYTYCYKNNNINNIVDSDDYHMISNHSNDSTSMSIATKMNVQILSEIYSIASVHPHVLDTTFRPICDLFLTSMNDIDVKQLIEGLKDLQSAS